VPTPRALDRWESAAFSGIFLASSLYCSQAESTPALVVECWLTVRFSLTVSKPCRDTAPQPAGLVRERKPLGAMAGSEFSLFLS
jgi:hypothetical protein